MPDGSFIRVEKVTFGKQEDIKLGGPIEKLKATLPASWQAKWPGPKRPGRNFSWRQNAVMHANDDALYIYISRRDPGKGYRGVEARLAQVVDKDGCVYESTQRGGYDDGLIPTKTMGPPWMNSSVGWFRFEAFPRRDKKFRLLVYGERANGAPDYGQTNFAEFRIANPAPRLRIADWPEARLPVVRTQDRLSFILTKVTIQKTNSFLPLPLNLKRRAIQADYEFTEDGQPSTNWQALETDLYDSGGNFVSGASGAQDCLCPRESAWKMRVKFFGSEKSRAASNAVWTLRGLAVPAPGQFTLLDRSQELQGVPVKAVTFGGAGNFTYSNNIPLEATPSKEPITEDSASIISMPSNWTGKHSILVPTFRVQSKSPHLAFDFGDLSGDQRLTVRAVDDQCREFYGHALGWKDYAPSSGNRLDGANYLDNWSMGEGTFMTFDLPVDAKTVDLTFCVHTCRTAEFIFKPPGSDEHAP
jgi:hypothetical protein